MEMQGLLNIMHSKAFAKIKDFQEEVFLFVSNAAVKYYAIKYAAVLMDY